jgi:hypothetical protein
VAIANYGELKTAIASSAHRTDLTSVMDTFQSMAAARINRDLRVMEMQERATDTLSSAFHPVPNDMVHMLNLHIEANGNRYRLNYLTPDQLDYEYGSAASGMPAAYTLFNSQIEFRPAPDTSYPIEMFYVERVADLVNDTDTNDVLLYYPDIYLYASLLEVAVYTEDDELAQKWALLYDREVKRANDAARKARYPSGNLQQRRG